MTMRLAKAALAILMLGTLPGCVSFRDTHGFIADEQMTKAIQPGIDNKDSVAKSLGRPTFAGQFSDNDWYYVSQSTKQIAFRNPHTVKETVLHISFDKAGNVASMETTDEKQIARVDPMHGRTPTLGRQRSLLQEIFGNISSVGSGGLPGSQGNQ